jgi:hypothetical protein
MFALRRARMKLRRRKTCKQKGKKLQNLQNYNFRKITSLHQIMGTLMMHLLEVQDYLLIFMIGAVLLIFLVLKRREIVAQSTAEVGFIARLGSC